MSRFARALCRSAGSLLVACVFGALLLAVDARIISAQEAGGGNTPSRSGLLGTPPRAASDAGDLLDAPVTRTDYRLGPGDEIALSIFGEINVIHHLLVTPEGTVVIPGVGVTDVLGLNLEEAQTRVRSQVLRYYRNVGINLTLSRIRQFWVHVVGDVAPVGAQIVSATTRVSEVVPAVLDSARTVLPRNVVLRRASGENVIVDLVRFQRIGDFRGNPVLREGDAIIVPPVDRTVEIHGRVAFPGRYEHRPGESLAELLTIANGGGEFPADASDTVRLSRPNGLQGREMHVFTRGEAVGARGAAFVLQPFDALYIPGVSDYARQHTATVAGQVLYPGSYPIRPGVTTVRDLVELAGGFAPDAFLPGATLQRRVPPGSTQRLRQLEAVPPELLSSQERRVLQAGSRGGENHVVVDFSSLFVEGTDAYNQLLRDGDVLTVPRQSGEVAVLGAVLLPGLIEHRPDWSTQHFITLAGGYARNADRGGVMVIRGGSGVSLDAADVRGLAPGDAIIVPYREHRDYLRLLQTTSTVVTTVTGLILMFIALAP
jgi:polysaccharide biosynthesis/export protein